MFVHRPIVSAARPRTFAALGVLLALTLLPSHADAQRRRERDRDDDDGEIHIRGVRVRLDRDRDDRRWRSAPDREVTMSVGALNSRDDDAQLPMAALRVDWRLRRWLRSELGVSYANGSIDRAEGSTGTPVSGTLQLATTTLGIRAELPTPWVRPYVGAAAGLVLRDEEQGRQYVRTTTAFPLGVRINLGDRVALRGEARWRFDQRRVGGEGVRIEQLGGLSVAF